MRSGLMLVLRHLQDSWKFGWQILMLLLYSGKFLNCFVLSTRYVIVPVGCYRMSTSRY